MTEKKGSGSSRTTPRANKAAKRVRQADPKEHGHPAAHKNKKKQTTSGNEGRAAHSNRRAHSEDDKPARIVVCTKSSHPRCEPGTFDAAALLASVLEAVQPTLREGLEALEEKLLTAGNEVDADASEVGQSLRAMSRQITDALRGAVIEGMRTRDRHLAQLVVIDRAAAQSDALARLQERIGTEIERAGLRRVVDHSDLSLFNLADTGGESPHGNDGAYELVTPAYVDTYTGVVVERGWLRRLPSAESSQPQGKNHGRVSHRNKPRNKGRQDEPGARSLAVESGEDSRPLMPGSDALSSALPGGMGSVDSVPISRHGWRTSAEQSGSDPEDSDSGGRNPQPRRAEDRRQQRRGTNKKQPRKDAAASTHPDRAGGKGSADKTSDLASDVKSYPPGNAESSGAAERKQEPMRQHAHDRSEEARGRRESSASDASRVASSYFVRRMLGSAADHEQPPRRSS